MWGNNIDCKYNQKAIRTISPPLVANLDCQIKIHRRTVKYFDFFNFNTIYGKSATGGLDQGCFHCDGEDIGSLLICQKGRNLNGCSARDDPVLFADGGIQRFNFKIMVSQYPGKDPTARRRCQW